MQKRFLKYFWDTGASTGIDPDTLSPTFRLKRLIEYASFPDLINYDFEEVKTYLPQINIDRLRANEYRKEMLKAIIPYLPTTNDWEEAIMQMFKDKLAQVKWLYPDKNITTPNSQ
ncbi:MAG TPA: hypothetical protein PK239_02950 [Chitinophagales bacterium]|nr:hypothetical protein [Chitinophagales bacterium]